MNIARGIYRICYGRGRGGGVYKNNNHESPESINIPIHYTSSAENCERDGQSTSASSNTTKHTCI